ncbi:ATP-dependent DNA ligase [Klenkia marina]|uniref:ATP-dependent DNA ligase n=1 Tax=Klenkia marina TaxID=1960309 RepID=UPI001FB5251E|nr:ATP-dependent DNA ligase [Klenkia marina]
MTTSGDAARALPGRLSALPGPVPVALCKAVEQVPAPDALAGGCLYEPKWDGFRLVIVRGATTTLWSRQGKDLTARFPDIARAAAAQLPAGSVVDGEVVIWAGDRLDFGLLQRRLVTGLGGMPALVRAHPASFVAFDVLTDARRDVRRLPLAQRRRRLKRLAVDWSPPMQLCPQTGDRDEALSWMADFRPAGVEGLVVKAAGGAYLPGRRDWLKVKSRETTEVIVGGVIGPLHRPSQLVAGRMRDGVLQVVGRSTGLNREQAAELTAALVPAGPNHPWPDRIGSGAFGGSRLSVPLTRVEPIAVAEVSADAALTAGVFRHPLRFLRLRPDLSPADVDTL